ncbi:MAG TPA: DUF4142 domain-containing protein [Gemmatimonadaceae bacterium]|nr:DUF4142 domain-containing protein [Gemmatimonadaceae bacterium]
MRPRRMLLSIAALAALTASCRLLRPVNPNAQHAEPEVKQELPIDSAAASASSPSQPVELSPEQQSALVRDARLNDAKISAVVLAANNTDISYARLVPTRASRADVKEFAQRMLTDHIGVNALLTELLKKLDVTPEDTPMSLDLRDESAERRDLMRELTGYPFDSTYIENEVSYHRKFLYAIDNTLQPKARNDELQMLLTNIRPAVAAHLAHAEQVRANVLTKR